LRAVLDTSALISIHSGVSPPKLQAIDEVVLSSVTYAELEFGVRVAESPAQAASRTARLAAIRTLYGPGVPFDDAVAAVYGTLFAIARQRGRTSRLRVADFQIAATAQLLGLPLITGNPADLVSIADVVRLLPVEV
jgi:predicted nucleic acid-binding protein